MTFSSSLTVPSDNSSDATDSSTTSASPLGRSGSKKFVCDLSSLRAFLSTFFLQLKLLGALPVTITPIPIIPSKPIATKPAKDTSTILIRNESNLKGRQTKCHQSMGMSSSNQDL